MIWAVRPQDGERQRVRSKAGKTLAFSWYEPKCPALLLLFPWCDSKVLIIVWDVEGPMIKEQMCHVCTTAAFRDMTGSYWSIITEIEDSWVINVPYPREYLCRKITVTKCCPHLFSFLLARFPHCLQLCHSLSLLALWQSTCRADAVGCTPKLSWVSCVMLRNL